MSQPCERVLRRYHLFQAAVKLRMQLDIGSGDRFRLIISLIDRQCVTIHTFRNQFLHLCRCLSGRVNTVDLRIRKETGLIFLGHSHIGASGCHEQNARRAGSDPCRLFTGFSMLGFQSFLFRGGFRPGCRLSGILSPLRRRMGCLPPCARALISTGAAALSTGCLLRLLLKLAFRLFPSALILTLWLAFRLFPPVLILTLWLAFRLFPSVLILTLWLAYVFHIQLCFPQDPFFHIPVEIIIIQIVFIRLIQIIFIFQHNLPAVHRRISSYRLPPIFVAAGT